MEAAEKQPPPSGEQPSTESISRPAPSPRFLIQCLVFALLLIASSYISNPKVPWFRGFELLRWEQSENASAGVPETLRAVPADDAFVSFTGSDESGVGVITSAPFHLRGALIEFQVAGERVGSGESKPPRVILQSVDGKDLFDFRFENISGLEPGRWTAYRAPVPETLVGTDIRLQLRTKLSPAQLRFAVRDRIDFFSRAPRFSGHAPEGKTFWALGALSLLTGLLGAFMLPRLVRPNISLTRLFLAYFAIAALVHLRSTAYFHWDEWHVLERFSRMGLPGVIYTHNEHFLPLFFLFYFIEAKLFGDHYAAYMIVSLALHALNATLLCRFLQRLTPRTSLSREAALILSFLFLVSCIHVETIQWVFEQSVLLCELVCLVSFLALNTYLHNGSPRSCAVCIGGVLAAPLLFGNGFILFIQLFALSLCVLLSAPKSAALRFRRLIPIAIGGTLCVASAAYLYVTHRDSAGHGVEQAEHLKPFEHLGEIFDYVLVGSQFGAILRGTGLFPLVQLTSADILREAGLSAAHPETLLAWLGFLLSLALLYVTTRATETRKRHLCIWLLGQVLIISCMLLPSVGRWQFGSIQALALRYHYATLIGAAVLCFPAAVALLNWCGEGDVERRTRIAGGVFALILFGQLFAGRAFSYYSAGGLKHRMYIAQLADWEKQLRALPSGDFEAAGTKLQGAQPVHLPSVTPGRHPNEIYAVLSWLNEKKYPK